MAKVDTVTDFREMMRSGNGRAITDAVLVRLIPHGLQGEAVRRFNRHAKDWNKMEEHYGTTV